MTAETRARAPTPRFEARREAIIASAVEELNGKGLRGMTLAEVAARLQIVPTAVIYYFRDKEALAAACLLQALERIDALVAAAASAAAPGPEPRITALVQAYFAFRQRAVSGAVAPTAVVNEVRALNVAPVNDAYLALYRRARRMLDGADGSRLAPPDRNARTHLLLAEIFWAGVWLLEVEPGDYPRAAVRAGSILTRGIAAPGAPWPSTGHLELCEQGEADSPRELFLRAATDLINAEGYHGASVERISARLKLSKGAFYHHNATKDELVLAAFERSFAAMWRAIHAAEQAGGSGLEILARVAMGLVARQVGDGSSLVRASALSTVPESLRPDLVTRFNRISNRLASLLCDGVADGSIKPVEVNVAAQMILGMIDGAADLRHWAPGLDGPGVIASYVRPLFEGLAPAQAVEIPHR